MEENLIKKFRIRAGYSQKEVSDLLHVTPSAVSSWEAGRYSPDQQNLSSLADLFGVTVDALLGRQTQIEPVSEPKLEIEFEDEVFIPIVASLQCGYGVAGEPVYTEIGKKKVGKSFIKQYGEEIVLAYANGKSMLPTIRPDELMVCYPSDWWDDGTIVVINVNGTDTVKRIYRAKDGGIDLIPDNPEYKIMHYTPAEIEDLHICVLAHVVTTIPPEIKPIPRRDEV